jgi:hypothetical protein
MPVHDWARVDAGIFHHFHVAWIDEIARALNRGLLPAALPEPRVLMGAALIFATVSLEVTLLPSPGRGRLSTQNQTVVNTARTTTRLSSWITSNSIPSGE